MGISEDIRDKIFLRGYTTKSGYRGFGLNIVKKIVDAAEGAIELKSDSGTCGNNYSHGKGELI